MANRLGRTIVAGCGGAAVLALALSGEGGAGMPRTNADPSPIVAPMPAAPNDVCCADAAQPQASNWDCIIGLNCGQIRPRRSTPAPLPPPPPQQ